MDSYKQYKKWHKNMDISFDAKNNRYSRYDLIILIYSIVGFLYQFSTLSIMFSSSYLTQNDTNLWNGFFPWWTIFFTFTFWSNFFVFLTYLAYLFCLKQKWLRENNTYILIVTSYITLVLIIVAFLLLPAALQSNLGVNFLASVTPLTMAGLVMPHGPGPILFIIFSILVFSFYKSGNKKIFKYSFLKMLGFIYFFFLLYMIMVIVLNWIPIGDYYVLNGKHIILPGYTVYSKFTALNPNLPILSDGKIASYGSSFDLLYYLLTILVMFLIAGIYYFSLKKVRNYFENKEKNIFYE